MAAAEETEELEEEEEASGAQKAALAFTNLRPWHGAGAPKTTLLALVLVAPLLRARSCRTRLSVTSEVASWR